MDRSIKKKGVVQYLTDHAALNPVWFHMPGHKGSAFYRRYGYGDFLDIMVDGDITEITGADNKFQAEGIIKETIEKYRELYEVKKSYLLVNGTSGGIISSILATVPAGKKVIMARNCHKSVFNALILAGADPVYVYPELVGEYNISGEVKASEIERLLAENPDAEAVIFPSPNYYGICSDIETIAEVVHKAGKVLIVDQAHGAHLKFFSKYGIEGMPKSAEEQGADITINSTHKTLATFTQSAVLNINSDRVDIAVFEDKLQMIESTSPSYLFMASHDMNAEIIREHGEEIFRQWKENLDYFHAEAAKIDGLKMMRPEGLDETKLNIDMSELGLSGDMLEEELMKYNIFVELTTGNILMGMTGIGNTREDMDRVLSALREISAERRAMAASGLLSHGASEENAEHIENKGTSPITIKRYDNDYPDFGVLELCGIPKIKETVPLAEAAGRVCASSIIPYPPGIPIVCPGERITQEIVDYVTGLRKSGHKVIGVSEDFKVIVGA